MAVPSASASRSSPLRRSSGAELLGGCVGTLTVLAVPLSLGLLAFASLGAAGPARALAAAAVTPVLGGLLFAALSRSPLPAAGPSSATTLVLAALVAALAADPLVLDGSPDGVLRVIAGCGAAVALSGVLQIVIARAGLTRLARLVPRPVLGGFMNGVALLILVGQLPLLLGLPGGLSLAQGWRQAQPPALLLGLATLALVVWLGRTRPRWPGMLIALVLGALVYGFATGLWHQAGWGARIEATAAPWPDPAALAAWMGREGPVRLLPHVEGVLTTALVLALIGALETVLTLLALEEHLRVRHDARRELQVVGLGNIACGLLGGLPVVLLRACAVSIHRAGGRSALAVGAGAAALGLLFFAATPLLGLLPLPVLGGILCAIGLGLVDGWTLGLLRRWWRGDSSAELRTGLAVMGSVCAITLWQGFTAGVLLGLLLSMTVFIVRMNRPPWRVECTAAERPSRRFHARQSETRLRALRPLIRIWELEGALFFGNADQLIAKAEAWPPQARALVLDLRRVGSIDETASAALARVAELMRRQRVMLQISGVQPGTAAERALRAFRIEAARQPDIDRATEAAEQELLGDAAGSTMVGVPPGGSELLRGLDAEQRSAVLAFMTPRRLAPGEVLFRQGDPADGLYVVGQGSISLIGSDGRSSQRFLSVSPGMMLGETAMLDGGGRSADAVADSAAVVHHLPADAWQRLGQEHPGIALVLHRNIATYLSSRLRAASAAWWADGA